jgi:hypothetical protein
MACASFLTDPTTLVSGWPASRAAKV